jgi:hypothetical protein
LERGDSLHQNSMTVIRRLLTHRYRPDFATILLWTLFTFLFFATLLAGQERLPDGDFTGQFHAFALFQAEEMLAGRFPLWTPGTQGGFPFAADPQSAAFYPMRWLTILLSAPWGLSMYVLQLEGILHIWLAGLFTYLLALDITNHRGAALLASTAFGLGGYLTSFPLLQLAILETITWLPLVLWLIRKATASKRPLRPTLAAGLALAVSLTAGHPQTFLHVAYLAAAYYVFLAWRARWSIVTIVRNGLVLGLVALGASAVTWLPAATLARYSVRADVSYEFVANGQPLLNYFQLLLPGLLSLWSPEYSGLLPLLLVLLAWFGRKDAFRLSAGVRAETLFWCVTTLLAAWLALGDTGLLFQVVYYGLPGISLFRQQERLVGIVSLALALLAAEGVAYWWHLTRQNVRASLRPAVAIVAFAFLLAFSYIMASPQVTVATALPLLLRQVAFALFAVALLTRRPRLWVLGVMLVFLLADLFLGSKPAFQRQPIATAGYWQQPDWMETLKTELKGGGLPRVDSRNLFHANVGVVYGLEDVHTIDPLKLQFLSDYESLPPARRWQLFGVTHVLGEEPPFLAAEPVTAIEEGLLPNSSTNGYLYRIRGSLPRAWFVYDPQLVGSPEEALALLGDGDFLPDRQVVLHSPIPGLEAVTAPTAPPQATVERLAANHLRIHASTSESGLLVIAEWAYPGWRAQLDGSSVPIYPANYAQQTVLVPPGEHTVDLRFVPFANIAGLLLALLTLSGVLVLVWRVSWPVTYRSGATWSLPAFPISVAPSLASAGHVVISHWRLVILLLLLTGAGLRLVDLGVQELRGDEAFSYLYAREPLREIVPALVRAADPHPPLHYLLLGIWLRLAGDSELALRLPSAMAGILLLPAVFQLGRRLLGRDTALVAVLLAALSPSLIWLSQDARSQYMLVLLLTVLATLILVRVVHRSHWRDWLLYALFAAFTMYVHYYGLFALLTHGLYLLGSQRRLLKPWLLAGLLALLLFTPWLLGGSPGWRTQLVDPGGIDFDHYLTLIGQELVTGAALPTRIARWPAFVGFLLAAGSFWRLCVRQRGVALLLGGWFLTAIWGIFLVVTRRATFNAFYISVAAPPWFLLIAAAVVRLWRSRWRAVGPVLALGSLSLFVLIAAFSLIRYYGDPFTYGRSQGYRPLVAYLAARGQSGDLIVPNFPDPSLSYYLRGLNTPQQMQPASADTSAEATEAALAELAARYDRIWFVPFADTNWDGDAVVLRWLDYHTLLEEESRLTDLTLQAYRPLRTTAGVLRPLAATLGDDLVLEGLWLTADGRPLPVDQPVWTVPSGANLNVSLVWETVTPVDSDWTVFVHLIGEDGRLLTQHDGVPVHGTRPTSSWRAGERLLDEHLLALPANTTARARLIAGMYDPETLERQPFSTGTTELPLGEFNIVSQTGE